MRMSLISAVSGLVVASLLTGCNIGFRAIEFKPELKVQGQPDATADKQAAPENTAAPAEQAAPAPQTTNNGNDKKDNTQNSTSTTTETKEKSDAGAANNPALDWLNGTPPASQPNPTETTATTPPAAAQPAAPDAPAAVPAAPATVTTDDAKKAIKNEVLLPSAEALHMDRYAKAMLGYELFRDFFYVEEKNQPNIANDLIADSQFSFAGEARGSRGVQITAQLKSGETLLLKGHLEKNVANLKDESGKFYARLHCLNRDFDCRYVFGYIAENKATRKSFVGFVNFVYSSEKQAYGRPVRDMNDNNNAMARLLERHIDPSQQTVNFSKSTIVMLQNKVKKESLFYSPAVVNSIYRSHTPDLLYKAKGQITFLRPRLMNGKDTSVWLMTGPVGSTSVNKENGLKVETSCVTESCDEVLFLYRKDKIQMKDSPKVANNAVSAEICAVEYDKNREFILAELCGSVPAGVILGTNEFEGRISQESRP